MASPKANGQSDAGGPFVPCGKILVVDEDPRDLENWRAVLSEDGYVAECFGSYGDALRCLDSDGFDFIVVCQGSCAFEGKAVLERIVEIDRTTPVLIVTRCLDMGCYLEAMQLGAIDYVEKPLAPPQMREAVRTHLRGRPLAA